jgi:hypothetical protein
MIMKTRTVILGIAMVAALNCTIAQAQVLGGGVGGALGSNVGGTMSGGMRDVSVLGSGNAGGSLSGDLDTGRLHRTARGAPDRTTDRVRNTTPGVRDRAQSTAGNARHASANVAASTESTAAQTVSAQRVDGAASAGSIASGLNATSVASQDRDADLPTAENVLPRSSPGQLGTSGNANGSASDKATVSKDAVAVHSSASVEGAGAANVSTQR